MRLYFSIKIVDVHFTIGTQYIDVAFQVLRTFLNCALKKRLQLEPFVTKSFRFWFHQGDSVKVLGLEAAPEIFIVPCLGDTLIFAAKSSHILI